MPLLEDFASFAIRGAELVTSLLVVATTLVMINFLAVVIIIITSFSVIFTFVSSKHSSVAWHFRLETPTS